ncbi:hypothetical protein FKP32DRAFT_1685335 [Trametes sanguinea]|nr:hypothetical protein FKP32DRAFT_1685335 [Trametes sanguinea]
MHLTLSKSHSSPPLASPPATPELSAQQSPRLPASLGRTPSSPTPSAKQEKGVKRIVSGLKRRISRTFRPGHRHHADARAGEDSDEGQPGVPPPPIVVSDVDSHPIPITLAASPRSHPSFDTLSRSVAAGGLGKHAADFSESDATSSSDDNSLFEGRRPSRRTASSDSGSFSYTSPDDQQLLCEDLASAPPLPLIEETESAAPTLTAPIEDLVLSPKNDAGRDRKLSLLSIESLTAPLETLILDEQILLPPVEALTAPLESLVLEDGLQLALTVPLPLSRPDSPTLPSMDSTTTVSSDAQPEVSSEARTATLDSELSASMELPRSEPLVSPPAPAGEPEVPDPFLREPADSETDGASTPDAPEGLSSPSPLPVTEEINLAPVAPSTPSPLRSPNVPPPPALAASDEEDEDEEDVPELYLPGLTLPTMFLPIPNTDPLSTLLTKYIPPEKRPPRDLTGDYSRVGGELHPMIMTSSWRAIARQARDRIVEADPEDVPYILSPRRTQLWYLRLSSLARMRLFNQTSAECTNLFTVLNAVEPRETREYLFDRILPFELEVLYARLKYWAGDHVGYLDALTALLRRCKSKARAARTDQTAGGMWTERGARVCLIIASQLVEMRDYTAAAKLLEPLCVQPGGVSSPALRSAVARVYLQGGYIAMAAKHFAAVAEDPTADPVQKAMNAALFASAEGDWVRATAELQRILAADPENFAAVNNLAVALLNQGRLQEAIQVLETALQASPATIVTAEPFLFNLSTLYELRSAAGADKKRELLIEVAKWAGDGLRTTCLKLPTN